MEELKLLIHDLHEHGHFKALLRKADEARPEVPRYDFRKDNIEEMKARSLQQQGFDMFASLLNITFGEQND